MTLAENIIAAHADRKSVQPGEVVHADVDMIYLQDGNTPTISRIFNEHGFKRVFNPEKIACFFDHAVLSNSINISNRIREAESFIKSFNLRHFKPGYGISHAVALEQGWYKPGSIVVGSDSHTCTGGVLQSMALGMGATDISYAMVSGKTWLKVPETVYIRLEGTAPTNVGAKDIMLYLLATFGQDPFLDRSIEWTGSYFNELSLDSSCTIANMSVELGANCSFLPPGKFRDVPGMKSVEIKSNSKFPVISVDVGGLAPFISKPHSPFSGATMDAVAGQKINYVFIGSCANGRLEDLQAVSEIFKTCGPVHNDVQCVVSPATKQVYSLALESGIISELINAGALVTPPGCGACVGTQGIVPADGDRIFSTMNRNFKGRMGNKNASIWLGSPRAAAYTAILGYIPSGNEMQ